jgi:stage II sporulation SpoAA-like protein
MIEKIEGLPAGIDGVRCSGKLTRQDYDTVVVPLLADVQREHRRLRCLVEVDGFDGITPQAAFDDLRLGLRALGSFDGCAVVTDLAWVGQVLQLVRFLLPYPVRIFPAERRADAIAWLTGLPATPAITHRVLTEAGVVVVEVAEPLGVADVEALATVVDGWLAEHPTLHGLVLHAHAFPGWENVGGLVRHLRFVIGHHRHVDRVALAVDGALAAVAGTVAELVARPQVRRFTFDELDAAIEWASSR